MSKKEGLSSDVAASRVDDFDDVDEKIRGRGDGVIIRGEKADPDDKRKARRTTSNTSGRCKYGAKAMVGFSVVVGWCCCWVGFCRCAPYGQFSEKYYGGIVNIIASLKRRKKISTIHPSPCSIMDLIRRGVRECSSHFLQSSATVHESNELLDNYSIIQNDGQRQLFLRTSRTS